MWHRIVQTFCYANSEQFELICFRISPENSTQQRQLQCTFSTLFILTHLQNVDCCFFLLSQIPHTTPLNDQKISTFLSNSSVFKAKFVTGSCCLVHGLRRTGDWSEAGITLSCCCSVICSVSPDRHWLVLIMATRGAGGNWSEKRTQNTRTVEPAEGQAHTDTRQEDAGWIFTYLSPGQQPRTASQHYSQFLCSHTAPEVAWWKLFCCCMWNHVFV